MCGSRLHAATTGASASAGQAADDDVEEGDNGVDDGLKDSGNGVNDGHDAVADGAEDRLDAGYNGAHVCGVVVVLDWVMEIDCSRCVLGQR